jgi:hypothetical protein
MKPIECFLEPLNKRLLTIQVKKTSCFTVKFSLFHCLIVDLFDFAIIYISMDNISPQQNNKNAEQVRNIRQGLATQILIVQGKFDYLSNAPFTTF